MLLHEEFPDLPPGEATVSISHRLKQDGAKVNRP
jgi:hypothetical protein